MGGNDFLRRSLRHTTVAAATVGAVIFVAAPFAEARDYNGQGDKDHGQECELASIIGTKHNNTSDDTIVGTQATDVIRVRGDSGKTVYAFAGDDIVCGNDGKDVIFGGEGADSLFGRDGGDTISGGDDGDTLVGDSGDDTLAGGAGDDTLVGDSGRDRLDGGTDFDVCIGTFGIDTFVNCEVVKRA